MGSLFLVYHDSCGNGEYKCGREKKEIFTYTPLLSLFGRIQIPFNSCQLDECLMQLHCYQESKGRLKTLSYHSRNKRFWAVQKHTHRRPQSYLKIFGGLPRERGIRTEMVIFRQLVMAVWSFVLKRMWGNIQGQWESILFDTDVCPMLQRKPVPRCCTRWNVYWALVVWGWECCFPSCTPRSQKLV